MRQAWLHSTALAVLVIAGPGGAAEPGTADGARALQDRLARYVGKQAFERRVVTIAPNEEGYRVTFDIAPVAPQIGETGITVDLAPFAAQVSRRPDGNWDVAGDYPEKVEFTTVPGPDGTALGLDMQMREGRWEGVVADATGTFLSSTGRIATMAIHQEDPASTIESTTGPTTYEWRAADTAPGEVSGSLKQDTADIQQTITTRSPPAEAGLEGQPALDIGPMTIGFASNVIEAEFSGFRSAAMNELWAFFVGLAEDPDDRSEARKVELRQRLAAMGSYWNEFKGAYRTGGVRFETQFGSATLGRFDQTFDLDGVVKSGDYRMSWDLAELAVTSDALPPVARDLIPLSANLNFAATGVDLATPAQLFVGDLDPDLPDLVPPETGNAILASFAERPPRLLVEPSTVRGRDYELRFDVLAEPDATGAYRTVTNISATGIDAVIAKLQSVGTNEAFQAVGMLNFAKGFGRPEADGRYAWTVERPSDGSVSINGTMISPPTVGPEAVPLQP